MVSFTETLNVPLPAVRLISIPSEFVPFPLKPKIWQLSMYTVRADKILMASKPVPPPWNEMLRRWTMAVWLLSLMITPFVLEARIEAKPAPYVPSRVIDLVIVTAPKPPGSMASISPLIAVLEIAPAKVLQGAVRLQGLTSSPTPDTQVRVAWAWTADATVSAKITTINPLRVA